MEDINEVLQGKLVEVVELVQLLQDGEDSTARSGDNTILLRNLLNLSHDAFGVAHLTRDLSSLCLESFECLDNVVIIKNVTTRLVQSLE